MKNIVLISGHTDLNHSVANKTIIEEIKQQVTGIEIDLLDECYPDYRIDVNVEQDKLSKADIIILQFPIFWYAMPSLMSKWIEDVFQHGFSHGATGDKLQGKKLVASFTTGSTEERYSKDGIGYEIEEFLPSLQATCNLCGLNFAGYVFTGGVSYQHHDDEEMVAIMKEKAKQHAKRLIELVEAL